MPVSSDSLEITQNSANYVKYNLVDYVNHFVLSETELFAYIYLICSYYIHTNACPKYSSIKSPLRKLN